MLSAALLYALTICAVALSTLSVVLLVVLAIIDYRKEALW